MEVLDGINHSGLGKVWFAGRGIASDWQMKRELLLPACTTKWSDILLRLNLSIRRGFSFFLGPLPVAVVHHPPPRRQALLQEQTALPPVLQAHHECWPGMVSIP